MNKTSEYEISTDTCGIVDEKDKNTFLDLISEMTYLYYTLKKCNNIDNIDNTK